MVDGGATANCHGRGERFPDHWGPGANRNTLPPIADGTQQRRLGVAHGWAGSLLATLRWCGVASVPWPAAVGERLAQLAGLTRPEIASMPFSGSMR